MEIKLLHKDDFAQVYDLDEPGPYYRGLAPSDYRMPDVLCAFLKRVRQRIAAARGKNRLRVLDFACGYGANGALLRHRLAMRGLYALYASDRASGDHREFFQAHRESDTGFEIGGLDLAGNALRYAKHMGFLDSAFCEDLSTHAPSAGLSEFLARVDLVVESGSLAALLPAVFPKLMRTGAQEELPWFLYCPRPDVQWSGLGQVWSACNYIAETCNSMPVRYRKSLSAHEASDVRRLAGELGVPGKRIFRDGYILVDLVLARPRDSAEREPLSNLVAGCDDLWG